MLKQKLFYSCLLHSTFSPHNISIWPYSFGCFVFIRLHFQKLKLLSLQRKTRPPPPTSFKKNFFYSLFCSVSSQFWFLLAYCVFKSDLQQEVSAQAREETFLCEMSPSLRFDPYFLFFIFCSIHEVALRGFFVVDPSLFPIIFVPEK